MYLPRAEERYALRMRVLRLSGNAYGAGVPEVRPDWPNWSIEQEYGRAFAYMDPRGALGGGSVLFVTQTATLFKRGR